MPMLGALHVISVKIERLKRSRQHGSVRMVLCTAVGVDIASCFMDIRCKILKFYLRKVMWCRCKKVSASVSLHLSVGNSPAFLFKKVTIESG